jgi:hypothetical protein
LQSLDPVIQPWAVAINSPLATPTMPTHSPGTGLISDGCLVWEIKMPDQDATGGFIDAANELRFQKCVALAQRAETVEHQRMWLSMANAWRRLGETPAPRRGPARMAELVTATRD